MGKLVVSQIPAFLDGEPTHAPRTLWRGAWSSDGHLSSAPGTHRSETGRLCARSSFLCRAECPASHPRLPLSSSARPLTGTCLGRERCGPGGCWPWAPRPLAAGRRRAAAALLRGNTSRRSRSPGILAIVSFVLYISGFWKLNGSVYSTCL